LKLWREVKEPQIGTEDELYSSLIKPPVISSSVTRRK